MIIERDINHLGTKALYSQFNPPPPKKKKKKTTTKKKQIAEYWSHEYGNNLNKYSLCLLKSYRKSIRKLFIALNMYIHGHL